MKAVATILMILYLGTSPVYWLPYLDVSLFSNIKFLLIASSIVLIWMLAFSNKGIVFPKGMVGPMGLLLLVLSAMFALLQAKEGLLVKRLIDMCLGFVMMWSFFLLTKNGGDIRRIFLYSALTMAVLCWLTVTSKLLGVPVWVAPSVFNSDPLYVSGFGSLRTGWSGGIALFIPVLLLLTSDNRSTFISIIITLLAIAGIVGSQLTVAGRAGLLASLMIISLYSIVRVKKIYIVVIVLLMVVSVIPFSDYLLVHLRFDRLEGSGGSADVLNHFSAGRIGSYIQALSWFAEKPFTGFGFGQATFGGHEIHNFWLRLLVEGGVLLPATFFSVLLAILFRLRKQFKMLKNVNDHELKDSSVSVYKYTNLNLSVLMIILCGVIISFFEPNVFLGSFQNTAIWWAAAGVAIAMQEIKSDKDKNVVGDSLDVDTSSSAGINIEIESDTKWKSVKLKDKA